jgi:hypothetical protein
MSAPGGLTVRLAAAATLAACLSVAACGGRAATPAANQPAQRPIHIGADSVQPGPPAGTRAEAHALATELLARLRLPPGARQLPPNSAPPSVEPSLWAGAAAALDMQKLFELPESITTAAAFLSAHVPPGLYLSVGGQGTGLAAPPGAQVAYTDLAYEPQSVPAGVYAAQVVLTIAPDASGGSMVRVDAQVIWYPPRSAAEYIDPARYHALTVSVTALNPLRTVTKVVTAQADITQLADSLNRSEVEPTTIANCPAIYATYRLEFAVSRHQAPVVIVTATLQPCLGVQISVDGRKQPPLEDGAGVVAIAERLIGFTPHF